MRGAFTFFSCLIFLISAPQVSQADAFSNNFEANINSSSLDALAMDVGALMGVGTFHHGKALGWPFGFDFGGHVALIGLQDENAILRDDGPTAKALWGQVEVGLPARFNLIGRVGSAYDADLLGIGLRYGLLTPSVGQGPAVSLSGFLNTLEHQLFDVESFSGNVVVSYDFQFVYPYLGVGLDQSKLTLTRGHPVSGEANGTRIEGGINLSIIPFTYLSIGVGIQNSQELYHVGAGIKI